MSSFSFGPNLDLDTSALLTHTFDYFSPAFNINSFSADVRKASTGSVARTRIYRTEAVCPIPTRVNWVSRIRTTVSQRSAGA